MATDIEVIVNPAAISTAVTVATEAPIASVTLAVGAPGPQGPAGANGQNGTNGSDASVTEEIIIAALGYTPADAANAGNPFNQSLNTTDVATFLNVYAENAFVGSITGDQISQGGEPVATQNWISNQGFATYSSIPSDVSQLPNDAGYITAADVPAQVNSDWNATSGVAEILNKPSIPSSNQSLNTTDSVDFSAVNVSDPDGYFTNIGVADIAATGPYGSWGLTNAGSAFFSGEISCNTISVNGKTPAFLSGGNTFTATQAITAAANTSALTASYSVTGANTTPIISLTGTWNTTGIANGILVNITDTASNGASRLLDLQRNGTSVFSVRKDGNVTASLTVTANALSANVLSITGANSIAYSVGGIGLFWNGQACSFLNEAVGITAQRSGTQAQTKRIYKTYTDESNYERGVFDWTTTANTLTIGTQAAGTGTSRPMVLNSSNLTVNTNGLFAASFSYYNGCVLAASVQIRNASNQNAWLTADNNNILAVRNGTSAQTLNVYNTFTSTSVFERLRIAASSDRTQLISESTGGTVRPLEMSFFSSASDPTTSNITSGAFAVWKNTGSGTVKLWVNDGGTMKSVALS